MIAPSLNMKLVYWLGPTATLLAATALYAHSRFESPGQEGESLHPVISTSSDSTTSTMLELQDQVRSLELRVTSLATAARESERAARNTREDKPSGSVEAPPSYEERSAIEYQRSLETRERFDTHLEREAADPLWQHERERELEDALHDIDVQGFSLADAECRATICRVTLTRDEGSVTQALGPSIMAMDAFKPSGAFLHYEDDRVTIYSPRPGHELPARETVAAQ